jgi:hypothetical protein
VPIVEVMLSDPFFRMRISGRHLKRVCDSSENAFPKILGTYTIHLWVRIICFSSLDRLNTT